MEPAKSPQEVLQENRIPFEEVNVERDPGAARDIRRKTGQPEVPMIETGGKWIVGFDRSATEREPARSRP